MPQLAALLLREATAYTLDRQMLGPCFNSYDLWLQYTQNPAQTRDMVCSEQGIPTELFIMQRRKALQSM